MNAKAKQRAEVILQVRSGQLTAKAAAQVLGISRQQYYQWEQRALSALLTSLADQPTGRPKTPADPEKSKLQHRVEPLEQQVQHYQQKEQLRQLLHQWAERDDLPPTKKTPNDPASPASARRPETDHWSAMATGV
jgi:transposase-like protein